MSFFAVQSIDAQTLKVYSQSSHSASKLAAQPEAARGLRAVASTRRWQQPSSTGTLPSPCTLLPYLSISYCYLSCHLAGCLDRSGGLPDHAPSTKAEIDVANLQEELRQHLAQAARIAAGLGAALPSEMAQRQTLAHKLPCAEAVELTAKARCSPPKQAWQCGLTSRVGGVASVSAQTMLLTAAISEGSLFSARSR